MLVHVIRHSETPPKPGRTPRDPDASGWMGLVQGFPGTPVVKYLLASAGDVREVRVLSLDREDSLAEGMATHSSILAWRLPWTEEPGGLRSMGVLQSWTQLRAHTQAMATRSQGQRAAALGGPESWGAGPAS